VVSGAECEERCVSRSRAYRCGSSPGFASARWWHTHRFGGSGVSYYCHRLPGNDVASEVGTVEREKTIIAIYAAWVAQKKYFPDCDVSDSWESDRATATALINELRPAKPKITQHLLCERAKQLVEANWFTIESLAVALLAKPVTPLQQLEFAKGWSKGTKMHEKFMSRGEVEDSSRKAISNVARTHPFRFARRRQQRGPVIRGLRSPA